jgi:hypothetical protein
MVSNCCHETVQHNSLPFTRCCTIFHMIIQKTPIMFIFGPIQNCKLTEKIVYIN